MNSIAHLLRGKLLRTSSAPSAGDARPWRTLFILAAPVMAMSYIDKCSGTALSLTLRHFTKDPALMTLLGSINIFFGFTVGPLVAMLSDAPPGGRTRRKPYMVAGLSLLAVSLFLLPLMKTFTSLVIVLVVYQFAMDMGFTGPFRPLYFDTVAKGWRGRGQVINRYAKIGGHFIFMQFMLGLFSVSLFALPGGGDYTGEMLIYHLGAVLAAATALLAAVAFTESVNHSDAAVGPPQGFGIAAKIKEQLRIIFSRKYAPLFVITACSVLMVAKMGILRPMLITRQFGYSPKQLGQFHVVTMLISAFVFLPLVAMVIDRWKRYYLVVAGLAGSLVCSFGFWCWVKFVTADGIATPATIITFKILDSLFDQLALLALMPLIFDFIPAGMTGRISAAMIVVSSAVHFVINNLLGVFVRCFPLDSEKCPYDYMSGYLYISLLGLVALVLTLAMRRPLTAGR